MRKKVFFLYGYFLTYRTLTYRPEKFMMVEKILRIGMKSDDMRNVSTVTPPLIVSGTICTTRNHLLVPRSVFIKCFWPSNPKLLG